MYTLGVKRDFIARHFLIGGDWGPENYPNSHHYTLELILEGNELDQHGYLVDIVDVEKHLDEVVNYYKEHQNLFFFFHYTGYSHNMKILKNLFCLKSFQHYV